MKILPILAFILTSCMSAKLSDTREIEEYPLRPANKKEASQLRTCLKSAFHLQEQKKQQSGYYYSKLSKIPLENDCNGLKLRLRKNENGFLLFAELSENENSVRWSINETGTMEEYLDPEFEIDENELDF